MIPLPTFCKQCYHHPCICKALPTRGERDTDFRMMQLEARVAKLERQRDRMELG